MNRIISVQKTTLDWNRVICFQTRWILSAFKSTHCSLHLWNTNAGSLLFTAFNDFREWVEQKPKQLTIQPHANVYAYRCRSLNLYHTTKNRSTHSSLHRPVDKICTQCGDGMPERCRSYHTKSQECASKRLNFLCMKLNLKCNIYYHHCLGCYLNPTWHTYRSSRWVGVRTSIVCIKSVVQNALAAKFTAKYRHLYLIN